MDESILLIGNTKGRPKGSKNKPKRGRPKKQKFVNKLKLQKETAHASEVSLKSTVTKSTTTLDSVKEINQNPVDSSFYYRGSKNVPIAGAAYEFTPDMIEEITKSYNDITYFAENFFYIVQLDHGKQKIQLYEAQKKVLRSLVQNRFVALLSCRQSGKSTLLTIFALWMVCFNEDYRIAIVANKETTAINIFKRVRMAYEQLPNYIKPGVKDYGKTGLTLGNDSSIIVSTTTATSIRGDSLNCVCLDEAAFIEPHLINEFWASVIPSVSSGKSSKVLMVSTPNGVGNKFYEMFSGAESGKLKQWKAERVDWWDVPGRDEHWRKTQIELLGSEEKFQQEYGNTFLDSTASAVGASVIEDFKLNKKPPIWTSEDGSYVVFEYPDSAKLYVAGVDVGEGIGRAASVVQILDVTDLHEIKQVAVYASSIIEPYHFANKLSTIGQSWGIPPLLIERNNCGGQVIDALFYNFNYEKIVGFSAISGQEKQSKTRNLGILSHNNIRFESIQNFRYWTNHLKVVKINDPTTISELETFVRFPNGSFRKRNDNFFDDRVMSLVWALFILEPSVCQQFFDIVEYDMQHKPQQIGANGFWENIASMYELRDLDRVSTIIPKPYDVSTEVVFKHVNITNKDLDNSDKYEYDVDELLGLGYKFV